GGSHNRQLNVKRGHMAVENSASKYSLKRHHRLWLVLNLNGCIASARRRDPNRADKSDKECLMLSYGRRNCSSDNKSDFILLRKSVRGKCEHQAEQGGQSFSYHWFSLQTIEWDLFP